MRHRWQHLLSMVVVEGVLIVFAIIILFPYYWMVVTTLENPNTVYQPRIDLFPSPIYLDTYVEILRSSSGSIPQYILNSLVMSLGSTAVCVGTALPAAYALARRRPPGSALMFGILMATGLIPVETVIIGLFRVVNNVGMLDTYPGIILPLSINAAIFYIMYNLIGTLPQEIEDAARVDGASETQVILKVVLPLSKPAVNACAVLAFLMAWVNFTVPYMLAMSNKMYPLAVGITFYQSSLYATMQEILTVSTIMTVPVLILFVLTQRRVLESVMVGALKG
jgi:multiple sugar transport system permease protein